jgi:acyl-CoA thioesterase
MTIDAVPMPAGQFARATAVVPVVADRGPGPGRWAAEIVAGWDIGGNANGGYLLAIAARAMVAAAGRPDPVTITAHYLSPGKVGPLTIEAGVRRAGRRFVTVGADVRALDDRERAAPGNGRPVLTVLGTFGDLSADTTPASVELVDAAPPDLPPPDECNRVGLDDEFAAEFRHNLDLRLHPDDAAFMDGAPSGRPTVRGWFRLRADEPIDTIALLLAIDAFPPTAFNARLPMGWTPTVELTAHVRARPAPGWLRCAFSTRFVTGGFLEEDGEVWDDRGRLVAQSRQLALVPRAETPQ